MRAKRGSILFAAQKIRSKIHRKKKNSSRAAFSKNPFARNSDSDVYREYLKDRCK